MKIPNMPAFRCGTKEAIDALCIGLNLPCSETLQDWSYTVGRAQDIEQYIAYYEEIVDEDQRFVLAEMMIQAVEDQEDKELQIYYWQHVAPRLEKNFALHEFTIYYWAVFDNDALEDCWQVTPWMRALWYRNTQER